MDKKVIRSDFHKRLYLFSRKKFLSKMIWVSDQARSMGIHLQAGKGSGKSRLMGRIIGFFDFIRGFPVVIFDPHGSTIDNFLDKLSSLPLGAQERLKRRVLYVDMSGKSGNVIPFPLYYRMGSESLYEISQRYLDVVRKIDPALQTASVEGWNPLWRTGTNIGMILAALNFQITEAEQLLRNPTQWLPRIQHALDLFPEVKPAISFLDELGKLPDNNRNRRTEAFFNKIALFSLDPSMKAMFGTSELGINWNDVVEQGLVVLLDFRHEHDIERRRFKMMWIFNYFLDFIKQRGAGRHRPISVIFDELTSLFSVQALAADLFASDLDELINVIARNYSIWLTIAHQELFQFSERLQKTLMSMGTQILGATSDQEAALFLSRLFYRYDPYLVKKREPIYFSTGFSGLPMVIDYRSVEFTLDEQQIMHSYDFSDQALFQFLVRTAPGEGDATGKLRAISIREFDRGQYPNDGLIAIIREQLMQCSGRPIGELLNQIEQRLSPIRIEAAQQTEPAISLWSE